MSVKVYFDSFSQPARAVLLFVRATNIPREEIEVRIGANQHKTEEYKAINPSQKIPAIDHNGFKLSESIAILRYLCRAFPVEDHWYPKDIQAQARVDEYLEWQHLGLRAHVNRHFSSILMPQSLGLEKQSEEVTSTAEKSVLKACDDIERIFLTRGTFISGEKISIADLLAVEELEQPRMVNFDMRAVRPEIANYLDRVKKELNPLYDDVLKAVYKYQAKRAAKNDNFINRGSRSNDSSLLAAL
ncbi:unnamed protein product, partial [Allacma fusca]